MFDCNPPLKQLPRTLPGSSSRLGHLTGAPHPVRIVLSMSYSDAMPTRLRSKFSIAFTSAARVLFTTLLFTAGGMGAGLFLGIVGTVIYGMISGNKVDMTNAYKHVAIPVAILAGCIAVIGSAVLEVRARRTRISL